MVAYIDWCPVGVSVGSKTPKSETIEACGEGDRFVDLVPTVAEIIILVRLLALFTVDADDFRTTAGD